MFEYYICNMADDELFKRQCAAIEKKVAPLKKEPLLEDVDGTLIQRYDSGGREIKVCSDHFEPGVYIESDIELKQFFRQEKKNG